MSVTQGEPPPAKTGFDSNLKRKTASSIVWTIGRAVSDQLFSFVVFLILARLLTKADIGLFSIAFVFSEVGRIIATNGLTQLIARSNQVGQRFLNTIFWANMVVAVSYAAIVLAGAAIAATALKQPNLENVLRLLSLAVVINATGATHMALRLREFGHKTIALRSIVSGLLGGSVAVLAALNGFGVWSLVIQRLVTETSGAILSWMSYKWRPTLEFDWAQAKQNFKFGGNLTAAQLVFLFLVRVQDIMIGAMLGAAAVGTYRVAWRCTEIFAVGAIQPFSSVALQTFSRIRDNESALRQAYRSMLRLCSAASFPVLVGFGVLSPQLIPALFGHKWVESGHLGQIFAFMAVPFTLNYFASPVLSAMGDSAKQRTLALIQLCATLVLTGILIHWGIWWVAVGYVVRAYLTLPFQILFLRQAAGITLKDSWEAIKHPFLSSSTMGVSLWILATLTHASHILGLAILIAAGAALYTSMILIISPEIRAQVQRHLRKYLRSSVRNEQS